MSGITTCLTTPKYNLPATSRQGKWCFIFLLGLLFSFSPEVVGQEPNYSHDAPNSKNLDNFSLTVADAFSVQAKLNRIIISVDTNPQGERFVLTFGNGIKKIGPNGGLVDFIPNQNNLLSNPMDFAINSEGKFFVATNESYRRFVRVYSSQGVYLQDETLGDGDYGASGANRFKGPVGLTFDKEDNLYVADHYIGEQNLTRPSSIKIYRKNAAGSYKNNLIKEFDNVQGTVLNFPYRLAVNSLGHLYMSELGQDGNAKVKIIQFDSNYNPIEIGQIGGPLYQIGSPGSIVIDKFDNVFVADFGSELDLASVLEATSDADEFFRVFEIIKSGIENDVFNINVYNPNNTFRTKISSEIDFPVDLAISNCGTLYVNNALFQGEINEICFFGCRFVPDITIDFDLEAYKRSSGYDTENPVFGFCPQDITVDVDSGETFVTVNYNNPTASDNCSTTTIVRTKGAASGSQFSVGEHKIEFTATDTAGNKQTCSFTIMVNPAVEEPDTEDPVISCPQDITWNTDTGECGAVVTYATPTATDNSGSPTVTLKSGMASGEMFPLGTTTIIFEAVDSAGNRDECSFTVTVIDNETPTISCPSPKTETFNPEVGFEVPDYRDGLVISDNCTSEGELRQNIVQTPAPGEIIYESQQITFTVKDAAENINSCSLQLTLEEEEEPDPDFEIDCVGNYRVELGYNISAVNVPTSEFIEGDISGIEFNLTEHYFDCSDIGNKAITIEATDIETGATDVCTVIVEVVDKGAPLIICYAEAQPRTLPEDGYYILEDLFLNRVNDNCAPLEELDLVQDPPVGTVWNEPGIYTVSFSATDPYGNTDTCIVSINLKEETPPVRCKSTTISLNDSGIAILDPVDIFDGDATASNIEKLEVDKNTFTCSDIGLQSIKLTVRYNDGTSDECTAEITVADSIDPVVDCPENQNIFYDPEEGYIIPDYKPAANPTDNCQFTWEQLPLPGTVIFGDQIVSLKAEDAAGNRKWCVFDIVLTPYETEEPLSISCLEEEMTVYRNSTCRYEIEDFTTWVQVNNPNAIISQTPAVGTIIEGNTTVTMTATLENEVKSCSFQLILQDNGIPAITCPPDQTENYDPSEGFVLPDYSGLAEVSDNCGIAGVSQFPQPGMTITADTKIILTVSDTSGSTRTCEFNVILSEEEVLDITCPENQTAELSSNCSFQIPDYRSFATTNFAGAQITQDPAPGTMVSESTNIILTATYEGNTDSCSFELILEDNEMPSFTCIAEQYIAFNPEVGYTLPDYREEANPSDNCRFDWVQTPAPGTVIFASQLVEITAVDVTGNRAWCSFFVRLNEEEPDELQITCPGDQEGILDSNCEYVVPDFRSQANINIPGAVVTQTPAEGSLINSDTTITLTATSGNDTATCNFELILQDVTDPVIACPEDQWENFDSEVGFYLPDYRSLAITTEACGIREVIQSPAPETRITQNTMVSITANDLSGNSVSCAFMVNLTEDEVVEISCPGNQVEQAGANCSFALPDYTGLAELNFEGAQISQAPEPGTIINGSITVILTATFNGQTDACAFDVTSADTTAPVANCIATGGYRLNQNGTRIITPEEINYQSVDNCGIVAMELSRTTFNTSDIGEHEIILTVTDAAGNSDSCSTTIEIWPYVGSGNDFACKTNAVLELDETGNAILTAQDLYTGDPQGRSFSVSRTNFTCSDLGSNTVRLTYTGDIDSGTCEVTVDVQDNLAPIVQAQNITVFLGDDGRVSVSPALLNAGTTDNCGNVTFSLSRTSFTCKDIGENQVQLTAVDASGNSASAMAVVTVTGTCDEEPPPAGGNGIDDVFIYPNPTPGPFTIATPSGIKISKVEVYDFRGRFLFLKVFPEDAPAYTLDITGVEQAVYVLKIETSDGMRIRRVIKY